MSTLNSSELDQVTTKASSAIRVTLGLSGIVALVVGVLILVWPGRTALVGTAIIAVYAIVTGVVYAALSLFAKGRGGWWRTGHILLALLFVAAGVSTLVNLRATTAFLAVFLAIVLGVMWVFEGIIALVTIGRSDTKGWSAFYAVVSVIAGLVLVTSPLWSAVVLWWLIGISLVVLGVMQIVRAFTFKLPAA